MEGDPGGSRYTRWVALRWKDEFLGPLVLIWLLVNCRETQIGAVVLCVLQRTALSKSKGKIQIWSSSSCRRKKLGSLNGKH